MLSKKLLDFLACPDCGADLEPASQRLSCLNENCKQSFAVVDGIPEIISPRLKADLKLSQDKWEEFYKRQLEEGAYEKLYQTYLEDNYDNVLRELSEEKQINDIVFLEIGCGPMLLGQSIAKRCKFVVGIDISRNALQIAKEMLDRKGITNYLLILGDINKLPIKNNSIDLLYGGGVIEHFKDTQKVINEMYRVLKSGGISFNTVPFLNLGSLTYRQIWGNIPEFPVLKPLAEFVHIKLLKSRHMQFGYELSFTARHLEMLHQRAGFTHVQVGHFDNTLAFEYVPFDLLKRFCLYLATRYRLFWPMVKVVGQKLCVV